MARGKPGWNWYGPRVKRKMAIGIDKGLIAAGVMYRNAVVEALRGGFTSGLWVTGLTMSSVTWVGPEPAPGGERQVRVGTNLMYNLYWELGHWNMYTRKYERVEIWRPLLVELGPQMRKTFQRQLNHAMRGGGKRDVLGRFIK